MSQRFLASCALCCLALTPAAEAITLPDGFEEQVVFTELFRPTAIRFAPDGRVFVAEKSGLVKVYDGLGDPTPQVVADLQEAVHDYWDRGLLGLEVDPQFPALPYIYVMYTYNFDPNDPLGRFPRWPDSCPNPPGGTSDGCTVNGRISRFQVAPDNTPVGGEIVLLENRWCQQFPSHSVGSLVFNAEDRVLYASAGEGASWSFADYGQRGDPENPCGDPPVGLGGNQSPPDAEGGALRAQDLRTSGDPVSLGGAVIAIEPDTGDAPATNPLVGGDPGDDLILAHGLRNPYRMTYREERGELWIGDVGKSDWDEINRVADVDDPVVENFGWPCYEAYERFELFEDEGLTLCEDLYDEGAGSVTPPYFAYQHDTHLDPDPQPFRCSKTNGAAVAGLAFYTGGAYPEVYTDALFFADYARDCLFVMFADEAGNPDPATRTTFADEAANPVDVQLGPGGMIYYVDYAGGRVLRIGYCAGGRDTVCDGLDDDCDQQIDEDYEPTVVSCGVGECQASALTACIDGAVVADCQPGEPTSDDNCNGLDDDCDGTADEDATALGWAGALTIDRLALSWDPIPESDAYDIVRGELRALTTSGGDYALAVAECVAEDHESTTLPYVIDSANGRGHWFLVRGHSCAGPGSYDTDGPGQVASRDAIDSDPDACVP